jgi:hypothetical protein
MTIKEAKERIALLHEVESMMFEQAWQSAGLPENMRDDLFDHICNDYTTAKMAKYLEGGRDE